VLALAIIPLSVQADHLGWLRWELAVIVLGLVAVVGLFVQAAIQSREDHERGQRDQTRDARSDEMRALLTRIAPSITTIAPLQAVTPAETRPEIAVYLEELTLGLRMLWLDKTFLFLSCIIVARNKKTSVLQIKPVVSMRDGSVLTCKFMESLSDWSYEPGDSFTDLDTLSLWKKLHNVPLEDEVKQSGWIGIEVPLSAQKAGDFSDVEAVELNVVDGAQREHLISFSAPWPVNKEHLIVAKHVRQR